MIYYYLLSKSCVWLITAITTVVNFHIFTYLTLYREIYYTLEVYLVEFCIWNLTQYKHSSVSTPFQFDNRITEQHNLQKDKWKKIAINDSKLKIPKHLACDIRVHTHTYTYVVRWLDWQYQFLSIFTDRIVFVKPKTQ